MSFQADVAVWARLAVKLAADHPRLLRVGLATATAGLVVTLAWRKWGNGLRQGQGDGGVPVVPLTAGEVGRITGSSEYGNFLLRWREQYGKCFRVPQSWYRGKALYVVSDPDHIREILENHHEKTNLYHMKYPSIFWASTVKEKDLWYQRRKAISRGFSHRKLASSTQALIERKMKWVFSRFDACKSPEGNDVCRIIVDLMTDIILEGNMGYTQARHTFLANGNGNSIVDNYVEAVNERISTFQTVSQTTWGLISLALPFSKIRKVLKRTGDVQDILAKKILDNYRATHTPAQMEDDDKLIACIAGCNAYPNDEFRLADIKVLIIAGYDTTAYTIVWALYALLKNPDCLAKCIAEIDACLGQRDVATFEDSLPYTDACVKETLRLFPVGLTGGTRTLEADYKVGTYTLPKGSKCHAFFGGGMRDDSFYNGSEFQPSRWMPGAPQLDLLSRNATLGFSAGRHDCVGKRKAHMDAKVVLATLLHNYDFGIVNEPSPRTFLTYKPDGFRATAFRRQRCRTSTPTTANAVAANPTASV